MKTVLILLIILCVIIFIAVILEIRKAPEVPDSFWRYSAKKKRIEILHGAKETYVPMDSFLEAVEYMKNSPAIYIGD